MTHACPDLSGLVQTIFGMHLDCFFLDHSFFFSIDGTSQGCCQILMLIGVSTLNCVLAFLSILVYNQVAVTYRFPSDHRSQAPSSGVSTWMGDQPGTPCAADTWPNRDLKLAECASLTTRILHNSP